MSAESHRSAMSFTRQDGVTTLSVASWQHDGFMQTIAGHQSFSGSGSSTKSEKRPFDDDELSLPANKEDVKEEVILMIAALEASALSRREAQDAGDCLFASSTNPDSIFEPSRPVANQGPPKAFHRRGVLWGSITRRMLHRARQSTISSPIPLLPALPRSIDYT
jgi:hypothetical protein